MNLLRLVARAVADLGLVTVAVLDDRLDKLTKRMESLMADMSTLLNEVADGLSGPLATSINDLIAERDALAVENATLKNEDAPESAAAGRVKEAFDGVAALFVRTPEAPNVEPLPDPPVVGEPAL